MTLSAVLYVEYAEKEEINVVIHFASTVLYVCLMIDRLDLDPHSSTGVDHLTAN